MSTGIQYTDKQMLKRLEKHLIDEWGSKFTVSKPTWECYKKRMIKDPVFKSKVDDLVAEADAQWHKMGVTALRASDKDFNANLYKQMTCNKKFAQDYQTLELEDRLSELEEKANDER